MAQAVTDSNKQGITRLINKSNKTFNDKMKRGRRQKVEISDDGKRMIAEIGLNHSMKIISKASEYANVRATASLPATADKDNKNKHITIKVLASDILNAVSFLALPSSPHLSRKYATFDKKKNLNSVFLQ